MQQNPSKLELNAPQTNTKGRLKSSCSMGALQFNYLCIKFMQFPLFFCLCAEQTQSPDHVLPATSLSTGEPLQNKT